MPTSGTNITSIVKSDVGQTAAPDWGTNLNTSLTAVDDHDHTSNKGIRITPAAINVDAELEFNDNTVSEVKQVALESQSSQPSDKSRAIYSYGGELYYRDASGNHVKLTASGSIPTTGGTIGGMASTDAAVNYVDGSKAFVFEHDGDNDEMGKMQHSTLFLYNFHDDDGATANYYITLEYTGTSSANTLKVPDETGTLLSSATSYGGGAISIATSASNNNIDLTPHGTGEVNITKVDIDAGAVDGVTIGTNSACTDLRVDNLKLDANTISSTDTNGDVVLDPNGTGTVKTDDIAASTTNGDLSLSANGTGQVKINGDDASNSFTLPDGRGTNNYVLQTDGSGDTSWGSIAALSTVDNIVASSAMNISGTVSDQTVYFGDTFTVNGTMTVNADLVLSNIYQKTSAMTLTNSSAQTLTGDGGATISGHQALFT